MTSDAPALKIPAVGSPAPRFVARSDVNERFAFDTVAGHYVVLGFLGSAGADHAKSAIAAVAAHRRLFDDAKITLFWVTADPSDRSAKRIGDSVPGIRVFWDFDLAVLRLWGLVDAAAPDRFSPMWFVLDPQLRMMMVVPMLGDAAGLFEALAELPPVGLHAGVAVPAPVLVLPRVFEPEFCRELIEVYKTGASFDSGFMRQQGEKTVLMKDYTHKRRRDVIVEDAALQARARGRLYTRLVPEIQQCFQFHATRIERYLVACYDASEGGYFKPHRDNTTTGTAHRRFAVTINLNAEEYEGGDLTFPEFGPQTYRAPTGGAVAFSCSMLHEALPVTKGVRYAFLPFLYDEAAAVIQQANLHTLDMPTI